MDNEHISTAQENALVAVEPNQIPQAFTNAISAPLVLLLMLLKNAASYLRPYAPQIIPVLIMVFLIPLILALSLTSGFVVWKNVAVGWESPLHLQFGDSIPPYARTTLPTLIPQQRYDVSVHLIIPAIESNFALGNFMTTLILTTPSNTTLASVRRSTIVFPPKKPFFGRRPSTISVTLPMLPSFLPGSSTLHAFVEVGRRDHWKSLGNGEGREISVISSSVRGSVVHHGIRGLVSRFPLTFAFISAIAFLAIISAFLAACILPAMFRPTSEKDDFGTEGPPKEETLRSPASSISDADEKPSARRRSRLSRTGSRRSKVKVEAAVSTIPSASIANPLRRRHSRPLDGLSDSDT